MLTFELGFHPFPWLNKVLPFLHVEKEMRMNGKSSKMWLAGVDLSTEYMFCYNLQSLCVTVRCSMLQLLQKCSDS